jgi:hypothetical protein
MNDIFISPKSLRSEFPTDFLDWNLDKDKIRLFKEQIQGWQLDIAKYLLFGDGKIPIRKHSAFASLSILTSYFENISRYIEGCLNEENSNSYFCKGLNYVYKNHPSIKITEDIAKSIYRNLRCGLYHVGLTHQNIILSEGKEYGVHIHGNMIQIAPTKFYEEIEKHFNDYCEQLKTDKDLRENFKKRFDLVKKKILYLK